MTTVVAPQHPPRVTDLPPALTPYLQCTDLSVTADHVTAALEEQGIVVMRDARADMGRAVRIDMPHVPGRESELVRASMALAARVACIESRRYLKTHYDAAVAEAEKVIDAATRDSRLSELRRFEPFIGQLYEFEVQAIAGNGSVALVYRVTACWFDETAFATQTDEAAYLFSNDRSFLPVQ